MKPIDIYYKFREELDKMVVPDIVESLECVEYIVCDGAIVGMVGGNPDYIDIAYILPEYRRKGLTKRAVMEWYKRYSNGSTRLHIINKNTVAYKFWHKLFELERIGSNPIDTLYQITKAKE
ncbi:MAG: GNAT family N-acetyltransferase [Clostridia bacterium]|nr:GNAT family N-acetyltransferase [Clostridia bacterium]